MPQSHHSGFTLIELMITLSVLGILVAIALPSFNGVLERRQLVSAADNLFSDLQLSKSEAIKSNKEIFVVVKNDDPTDWCYGIDDDGDSCDCNLNECEVGGVAFNRTVADFPKIQLTSGQGFSINPRQGMPTTNSTFTLRIGSSGPEKRVTINTVGNVKVN